MPSFSALPLPVSELPVISADGCEVQMEVPDLNAAPVIRIYDRVTGDTHRLSLQMVEILRNYATGAVRSISVVQNQRFAHFHPARDADLAPLVRQGNLRVFEGENGEQFHLGYMLMSSAETDSAWQDTPREGEPKMVWIPGSPDGSDCGWSLTLQGAGDTTQLGFAAWNDADAIARLVTALQDRQSAFVMSGIVDSEGTARLSSRMTALSLRRGRKLPAIRLKAVRDVLEEAGLANSSSQNQYTSARGRVLSIQIDEAAVPVAVLVMAPQRPTHCDPMPSGLDALPWNERQTIVSEIESEGRARWTAAAQAALSAKGWRLIDLPLPGLRYAWRLRRASGDTGGFFFVTRIKPEIWSEVDAAARSAVEQLNVNRSSLL